MFRGGGGYGEGAGGPRRRYGLRDDGRPDVERLRRRGAEGRGARARQRRLGVRPPPLDTGTFREAPQRVVDERRRAELGGGLRGLAVARADGRERVARHGVAALVVERHVDERVGRRERPHDVRERRPALAPVGRVAARVPEHGAGQRLDARVVLVRGHGLRRHLEAAVPRDLQRRLGVGVAVLVAAQVRERVQRLPHDLGRRRVRPEDEEQQLRAVLLPRHHRARRRVHQRVLEPAAAPLGDARVLRVRPQRRAERVDGLGDGREARVVGRRRVAPARPVAPRLAARAALLDLVAVVAQTNGPRLLGERPRRRGHERRGGDDALRDVRERGDASWGLHRYARFCCCGAPRCLRGGVFDRFAAAIYRPRSVGRSTCANESSAELQLAGFSFFAHV